MKSMVWAVFQYGAGSLEISKLPGMDWSGGMDFEEIGQKQNRSFWIVVLEKNA